MQHDGPVAYLDPAVGPPANHLGVEPAFLDLDPRRQAFGRVALEHRHRGLRHDRTTIRSIVHEMYCTPAHGDAGVEHRLVHPLPIHPLAAEGRQQRRVCIQDTVTVTGHERGREDAQEPCQAEQIRLIRLEGGGETLDIRTGKGWAGVIAALAEGRCVLLAGDSGNLDGSCAEVQDVEHGIFVHPDRDAAGRYRYGDPWCAPPGWKWATADALKRYATPLGMHAEALPGAVLAVAQGLIDLAYGPVETPALAVARSRGIPAIDGVSLLVAQAAASFEIWTGREAPRAVMEAAARYGESLKEG